MVSKGRRRVFVIYGRDTEAHGELVKFIRAVGLEELAFESVANELGPSPFIAEVVLHGLRQADAVIALFTPDEHAGLYEPTTGASMADQEGGSRWQARPNVLFEAGVAYGKADKEPILAVLGADVRLFSDLAGKHLVQLASSDAKRNLFQRLTKLVGSLEPTIPDWETSSASGDFARCVRARWRFFDEINELIRICRNRKVGKKKQAVSLEVVLRRVVSEEPDRDWSVVDPRDFMEAVKQHFDGEVTDDAYWWFLVYGFFRFNNIHEWGIQKNVTWDDSVDNARLAPRGAAVLERIRLQGMLPPLQALQPKSRTKAGTRTKKRARARRG
jgi:hypothetical protein